MSITIALIHMKMRLLAKRANMDKARKLIKQAAVKGAKIVVLPSMVNVAPFYLVYPPARAKYIAKNQAERIPGSTSDFLSMTAVENGVYIIAGPIIERAGPRLFLTTIVLGPDGDIAAKYRKIAVNSRDEELGISGGREFHVIDAGVRKAGLMAEDDIYYPEIARSLLVKGATLFITPLRIGDNVQRTELILSARAVENHTPILAVGGILETSDRYIEMPTMVIHPDKGVDEKMSNEESFILVEVSPKPDSQSLIDGTLLLAKNLSQIYCRAFRQSI